MPSSTTCTRVSTTWRLVSAEITCRTFCGSKLLSTTPSGLTSSRATRGRQSTPPFTAAANAVAICSGVTEISWPMATDAIERPDHRATGRSRPTASPGRSMPVLSPKPKALR